ncbi:hypothetical protein L3Y34_019478 [Caenorhabditis briggsae]|uniref:Uncharacterized protein n=2 Tax=Caenorhabditis briggsae TaxID=6238 RepID=A0AAE9IW56_CAEBR|nr:hypothetical protein L3Y34_019478 [Caenorhabditis briggsae]
MGRFFYFFYNFYLISLYIILFIILISQIQTFFPLEHQSNAYHYAVFIFNAPIMIRSCYDLLKSQEERQTPRWFIWNRYLVAVLVLVVNFGLPASNVLEEKYSIILTIVIGFCLMLFFFSIYEHCAFQYYDFRLSFPKDAKLTNRQIVGLILFHILIILSFCLIFSICPNEFSTYQRYQNNHFIRIACHLINIMLIPLNYCAVLAWNSKKLNFRGIHPGTKRRWVGVMKKDKKGRWVVDVEPEDHRIFVV